MVHPPEPQPTRIPVRRPGLARPARRSHAPFLVVSALLWAVPISAQSPSAGWRAGLGLGMAVDLDAVQQDVDAVGLGARAAVTRGAPGGPALGLQWDGAWFEGRYATEKRLLLSAVVEAPLAGGPVVLRTGPGLGMLTVVDVDLPEPGTVGDALISIGDTGAWGLTVGVAGRLRLGSVALEPLADLVWLRADGRGALTLVAGGSLVLGG